MEAEISRHSENEVTENLNAFPSDFGSSASSSQTLSCEMEAEDLIESNDEVTQTLDARVNPPLDISAALLEDFGQSRSTNLTLSCKMEAEALRELKDEVSETLAARVFNPSLNVSAAALPADFGPSTSTSQKFPYTMEAEALIESKDNITEYRCAHAFNSSMDVSTTFGRDLEPPESSSQMLSYKMETEVLIESKDEVTESLDARVFNPPLNATPAVPADIGPSTSSSQTSSTEHSTGNPDSQKGWPFPAEFKPSTIFSQTPSTEQITHPNSQKGFPFPLSTKTVQNPTPKTPAPQLDHGEDEENYHLPTEADRIVFHSSYVGKASIRDPENGSWFIQKLCEKIKEYGLKHDLETIFRMVRRTVALDCDTEKDWKQMPVVTSTTLRELYLAPNLQQEDEQPRPASPYVLVCPTSDSDVYPVSHQLAERLNEHVCMRESTETITVPDTSQALMQLSHLPCCCFLEYFEYLKNCLESFSRHNKKDPVAKSLLKLVERTGSGSEYNLQKFDYIQSMWEHFEANKDSFPPDGFSFVHRMHMPLNEPETERTPTELDNFEYQSMSRKNKMTERTPSKDEENEITETIDILEWTQTLSLTSTVTRHIYLKNKKAEESFPPDEEDDEDIENNSISYTPVTNSQNSKNDCTVASPQSSFMNGGIQRGSTFESLPATYELDKFQKNAMVIFNHEKYAQRDVSPRIGTEYDKNALKKTFQRFRFEVTTYDDLSKEELLSKLTECLSRQNTGQFCYVGFHGKGIGFNFFVDVFPHAASVVDRDAGRRFCAATSLDGKYMAIDTSPLSVYVMHPFWNKVVEFVPRWVAPNLLTFLGFLLTVLDFVLLSYYDYSYTAASARNETIVELSERPEVIPQTLWYALAVFLFLAYTLDGIDGKQARRTQTSGPLGELFDHGLDSYSVFFIPACLMYYIMWNILLNFYLSHWEKYNTGVLFLPWGYDFSMWILQARNGQDAYHVGSAPAAVVSAVGVRASAAVGLALPHHEVTAFYGIVTLSVLAHIHYGACVVQQMCEHFRISCFHIKKRVD
ncbi:hypothetical protein MSG28_013819 [Choristoneura fumiferana]|uniref:Uncharacterized protein n=1 Tax=Choristoneura fumiferana TaxID=7141 RepID=A0ACC0K9S3_CHOFU|nr:hypothetical protein MSG28_013819 [Choristoneura fumiferana]